MTQRRETFAPLEQELARLESTSALRRWRPRGSVPGALGPVVRLADQALIGFASNDYLGLAQHPHVLEAAHEALARYGVGATAANGLGGYTEEHAALEQELAAWLGRSAALLFSSGYLANLGVQSSLVRPRQVVLHDRLNHASLLDGGRLAQARIIRYAHADAAAAVLALERHRPALCLTESLFSMDGDIAPIAELATGCAAYGTPLIVDEAHALGVLGPAGRGVLAALGLGQTEVPLVIGTLGKAFGSQGAFVAGDATLVGFLRQKARTANFSTALGPVAVAAARAALRVATQGDERRQHLSRMVALFRALAQAAGVPLLPASSCIQAVPIGGNARAVEVATALETRGYWVPAIRPPTVPEGSARLRISLGYAHQAEHVEALVLVLTQALGQAGLLREPGT